MQFTEEKELDDINVYARSLQARRTIHENPNQYYIQDNPTPEVPPDGKYEYEKVLADTPPDGSPILKTTNSNLKEIFKENSPEDPN